jgi:hypothetical protein
MNAVGVYLVGMKIASFPAQNKKEPSLGSP